MQLANQLRVNAKGLNNNHTTDDENKADNNEDINIRNGIKLVMLAAVSWLTWKISCVAASNYNSSNHNNSDEDNH